mgnify:CR=1 FL=1
MEITGFLSAIGIGIVIGVIARILVRNNQPIGCILTVIIGILGAAFGAWIGNSLNWGFWLTFLVQILIAVVLVAIVAGLTRNMGNTT